MSVPDPLSPLAAEPDPEPRGTAAAPPDATPRLLKALTALLPSLLLPELPSLLPCVALIPLTVPLALAPGAPALPGPSREEGGAALPCVASACCSDGDDEVPCSLLRHVFGPSHDVQAELARPPAALPRKARGTTTDCERGCAGPV